jgi:sec-independent protein translocase protein TatB
MFDFGFSELLLIAVVALVVLGPERLPKAARFVGLWVRRARAQWYSVKSELERELAAEELKRDLHDAQAAMRDLDSTMRGAGDDARREFEAMREQTLDGLDPRSKRRDDDEAPPVALTPTDSRDDDAREQDALEHDEAADAAPPAVTPGDRREADALDRAAAAQAVEDAPDQKNEQHEQNKDAARDGQGR